MTLEEGLQKIANAEFPMTHRGLSKLLDGAISHASVSRLAKLFTGLEPWGRQEAETVWKHFVQSRTNRPRGVMNKQKISVRIELSPDEWAALGKIGEEENLQPQMIVYRQTAKYISENKTLF